MPSPAKKSSFRHLADLLPVVFQDICRHYQYRPDLIVAAWPEILSPQLAPMTEALSFYQGVLTVKVKNATLYSLLVHYEKNRLLKSLKEKFPKTEIKNIHFRLA